MKDTLTVFKCFMGFLGMSKYVLVFLDMSNNNTWLQTQTLLLLKKLWSVGGKEKES